MARRRQPPKPKWTRCPRTGKRGFTSKHDALVANANLGAAYVRAYDCPFCGRWHVTSQAKRKVTDASNPARRKERPMGKTDDTIQDPTRAEERATLESAKDDGFKPTFKKGFEVARYDGQRVYFSDDLKDAQDRLAGIAAGTTGIGTDGEGEPAYTIREVSYIEVESFDPDGPESRTRGKRSGAPAEDADAE